MRNLPRFESNYAGIYISDARLDEPTLASDGSLSVSSYFLPGASCFSFVVAGEHPEPVTRWLRAAHRSNTGISMLAAVCSPPTRFPTGDDSYLFRFNPEAVGESALTSIIGADAFVLFLPHSDEILALTTGPVGLQWLERNPKLPLPIAGLVNVFRREPLPVVRRQPTGTYDPIASQVREVLGPVLESTLHAVDDLRQRWSHIFGDVPHAILEVPSNIAEYSTRLTKLLTLSATAPEFKEHALAEIDAYAHALQDISTVVRDLSGRLSDHDYQGQGFKQKTYETYVSRVMLRAAANYVADVAARVGLSDAKFYAFFGRPHSMQPLRFSRLLDPATESKTFIVYLPDETRLRLGSLPILAHEVAHAVVSEFSPLCLEFFKNRDKDPLVDAVFSKLLTHHAALPVADELSRRAEQESIAARWSLEIICDLVATLAVGPSFVYAFSRFLVGTLRQFEKPTDERRLDRLYPPLAKRLTLCLALLRAINPETVFNSAYISAPPAPLSPYFVRMVREIVRDPASMPSPVIPAALRVGRIPLARPTDVVASIWSAVANRTGYLHEIAAMLAVAV